MNKNAPGLSCRSFSQFSAELRKHHRLTGSWKKVADKLSADTGINFHKATVSNMAAGKYEPKDSHVRYVLRLPALAVTPTCIHCGEVHVSKRCPKRKRWNRIADMPVGMLRKLLEEREVYRA